MGYISAGELEKFDFRDCVVASLRESGQEMQLELEALIVKATNSQNRNFTDSYADRTTVLISDMTIESIVKEGYRYYDANDTLLEEVEDEELAADEVKLSALLQKTFLYSFRQLEDGIYSLEFEIPDEDPTAGTDSYELRIRASKVQFSWENYLNRVQY